MGPNDMENRLLEDVHLLTDASHKVCDCMTQDVQNPRSILSAPHDPTLTATRACCEHVPLLETAVADSAHTGEQVEFWPSAFGGKNWSPMSFNPETQTAFINTLNIGMNYKAVEPQYRAGVFYFGAGLAGLGLSKTVVICVRLIQ